MGRRGSGRGPYRVGDDDEGPTGVITARGRALDAQLARLTTDGRVRAAALIGQTFRLDPVAVLTETDPLKRLVRLAAHNFLQNEAEKHRPRRR